MQKVVANFLCRLQKWGFNILLSLLGGTIFLYVNYRIKKKNFVLKFLKWRNVSISSIYLACHVFLSEHISVFFPADGHLMLMVTMEMLNFCEFQLCQSLSHMAGNWCPFCWNVVALQIACLNPCRNSSQQKLMLCWPIFI